MSPAEAPAPSAAVDGNPRDARGAPRADAIVVLGCRVLPSGRPTAAAALRAAAAAEAFRAGAALRVVVSGGRRWGRQIEARVLREELARAGVPREAVLEELVSLSTRENAERTAELLRRRGAAAVLVVTCDWHLPRALACFERAGLRASGWPAPSPAASLGTRARRTLHEVFVGAFDAWIAAPPGAR
jgi:uncharacterized SAM-binding protein YcdF (DUF218 family)